MSKYIAKFNGGPLHGQEQPCPQAGDVFHFSKVYDSGLTTQSKYLLKKADENTLYYDIIEEKFVSFSNHLQRNPR